VMCWKVVTRVHRVDAGDAAQQRRSPVSRHPLRFRVLL
jgi:hypothetical protein